MPESWSITSIFHFTVNATDFDRSLAFYTTIGFKVLRNNRDVIWPKMVARNFGMPVAQGRGALLAVGDGELHTRIDLLEWLEPRLEPEPDTPRELRVPRVIALRTVNVQAAYEDLSARGIEFVSAPRSSEPAGIVNVCSCRDPDGVIVEFIEYEPGLLGSRIDSARDARVMTDTPRLTEARGEELFALAKRWGRWGSDDQRGALNLLTPERVQRATALAQTGEVVSCGRELPVRAAADNPNPALHHMTSAGDVAHESPWLQASTDFFGVAYHGMAVSHIDALCHVFVDKQMYNGAPASDVTSVGARRNSIEVAFGGIVGRGVLLDIPRLRGVDWLEPGDAITPDELDAAAAAEHVTVESGDILLVSTGRDARRAEHGPWNPNRVGLAGLDAECVPWLCDRDPAVLGSDGVSDVLPATPHRWAMPLHQCLLVGMGVHLLDNLRLDRIAAACAARERWEFLFVIAPLQIGGGTGSPVNPVAIL